MTGRYNRSTLNTTAPSSSASTPSFATKWLPWLAALAVLAATWHAWQTSSRINGLEAELVKRQDASQAKVQEALLLAKQSQDLSREASARVALLDAKLADLALQRTQLDTLVQSLNRSRDENLLADLDASLRVAMQQSALTGSPEPLVAALESGNERLNRAPQPRLDPLRRALAKDLGELKDTHIADLPTLAIRLDEAIHQADELPLLSQANATTLPPTSKPIKAVRSIANSAPTTPANSWSDKLLHWSRDASQSAWQEAKTLIRVTKIAQPESALLAPEQSYFLRENFKLRLLNARLSLMSRQTRTAISDLQSAKQALDRYFDPRVSKTLAMRSLLIEVADQAKQAQIPRPDDTLAAIASLNMAP
jgi:uroporphyrin-III C-methyltransferase